MARLKTTLIDTSPDGAIRRGASQAQAVRLQGVSGRTLFSDRSSEVTTRFRTDGCEYMLTLTLEEAIACRDDLSRHIRMVCPRKADVADLVDDSRKSTD